MADQPRISIPFMVIRDKCGICGSVVMAEDSLPPAQRFQRAHRSLQHIVTTYLGEAEPPDVNFLADLVTAAETFPGEQEPREVFSTAIKHNSPNLLYNYLIPVESLNGTPAIYYPTSNVYNALLDDRTLDQDEDYEDRIIAQAPGVLIHQACLKLAKKAMAYRIRYLPRSTVNIESELDLNRCLTIRFSTNLFTKIDWSGTTSDGPIIYTHWENPNKYHGAADYGTRIVPARDVPGFVGATLEPNFLPKYPSTTLPLLYQSNPFQSEYATPVLVNLLRNPRLSKPSRFTNGHPITKSLQFLPTEILNRILGDLFHPFTNASLKCNYILPLQWWYEALRTNGLIPWLYDVEFKQVEMFLGKGDPGKARDWEMVARILSQDDVMEKPRPSANLNLKNRRRIWRLCMEMQIGDSAVSTEHEAAMERYKNRGGRFLPPPPPVGDKEGEELVEA